MRFSINIIIAMTIGLLANVSFSIECPFTNEQSQEMNEAMEAGQLSHQEIQQKMDDLKNFLKSLQEAEQGKCKDARPKIDQALGIVNQPGFSGLATVAAGALRNWDAQYAKDLAALEASECLGDDYDQALQRRLDRQLRQRRSNRSFQLESPFNGCSNEDGRRLILERKLKRRANSTEVRNYNANTCMDDKFIIMLQINADNCAKESRRISMEQVSDDAMTAEQRDAARAEIESRRKVVAGLQASAAAMGPALNGWLDVMADPDMMECLQGYQQAQGIMSSITQIASPGLMATGHPYAIAGAGALEAGNALVGFFAQRERLKKLKEEKEAQEGEERRRLEGEIDTAKERRARDHWGTDLCAFYKLERFANDCASFDDEQDLKSLYYKIECNKLRTTYHEESDLAALDNFFDSYDQIGDVRNNNNLNADDLKNLDRVYQRLAAEYNPIAEKEARGEPLTDAERGILERLGGGASQPGSVRNARAARDERMRAVNQLLGAYSGIMINNPDNPNPLPFDREMKWDDSSDNPQMQYPDILTFLEDSFDNFSFTGGTNPSGRLNVCGGQSTCWQKELIEKKLRETSFVGSELSDGSTTNLLSYLTSNELVTMHNFTSALREANSDRDNIDKLQAFADANQGVNPTSLRAFREISYIVNSVMSLDGPPAAQEGISDSESIVALADLEVRAESHKRFRDGLGALVNNDIELFNQQAQERERQLTPRGFGDGSMVDEGGVQEKFRGYIAEMDEYGILEGIRGQVTNKFKNFRADMMAALGQGYSPADLISRGSNGHLNEDDQLAMERIIRGNLRHLAEVCSHGAGLWFGRDMVAPDGSVGWDTNIEEWDKTCGIFSCPDGSGLPDLQSRLNMSVASNGLKSGFHYPKIRCNMMKNAGNYMEPLMRNFREKGYLCSPNENLIEKLGNL